MVRRRFNRKVLTVTQQIQLMTAAHPHFRVRPMVNPKTRKPIPFHSAAIWIGEVQPTPLSRKYQARIEYKVDETPRITIISPKLSLFEGAKKLPHVYPDVKPPFVTPVGKLEFLLKMVWFYD